jgi:indole-3-acetate monooxygenase
MYPDLETQPMIPFQWKEQLAAESGIAEQQGSLTKTQLEIIHQARWFRMFLPASMGGLDLSLPEGLRLEESLAGIDGSLGWTITLCSGATMFAGFMAPKLAVALLRNPKACFGGSGAPNGVANREGDSYRISGRWKYATGAPHLTAFTANCRIMEEGLPVLDANGQQLVQAFVFTADEVEVYEDWNTMGLRATAGHSFSVVNLLVDKERAFDITPEAAQIDLPIFRYPFLPFAETTIAVNTSGMVQHFLECCETIFSVKALKDGGRYKDFYSKLIIEGRQRLEQLRIAFYAVADASWEELCHSGACSDDTLSTIGRASTDLAWGGRRIAEDLFPYCRMAATDPETPINRVWRDLFTASQHSLLNRAAV